MAALLLWLSGCGVYSFTGATVAGKTIQVHVLTNQARNIAPTLAPSLTDKIRNRIVSQTGLTNKVNTEVDYDIAGSITQYEVTVTGVQNTQQASQNRLTISVNITFTNRLDEKASFNQTFTRFSDFGASQSLQAVQGSLIDLIGTQLADDIFNKAFVNW